MTTPGPLHGRHALVTGGGSGIGAAIAIALAGAGARVSLAGRRTALLETVAATLGSRAGDVRALDVTDEAAIGSAIAALPPVDILINNAGQATSASYDRTTTQDWARMMAVNAGSVFLLCRAVMPGMVERRWGRVINVASTAGLIGYSYVSAYVAAKHAVVGLTRALALEVARKGVTVNALCPGFTETPLIAEAVATITAKTGRSADDARGELAKANPQGRLVHPGEVADAALWLAGPGASAITGQAIAIAGGEVFAG